MFKGLRTKIESEQKGQPVDKTNQPITNLSSNQITVEPKNATSNQDSNINDSPHTESNERTSSSGRTTSQNVPKSVVLNDRTGSPQPKIEPTTIISAQDEPINEFDRLKGEVASLNTRLTSVIEERDENVEQNAQLYQLIEKLRGNLDIEKKKNSDLTTKLTEAESALKYRMGFFNNVRGGSSSHSRAAELLGPDGSLKDGQNPSEVIKLLQNEIIELQNQLAKKNRQLKINQQNVNDIKKSLQKEIIEHGRTQDKLQRLEEQLKQAQNYRDMDDRITHH